MDGNNVWLYHGKGIHSHDDLHPDCTDFVYMIKFKNGREYIGKKAVRAVRRKPPLKGKKRNRRIMTNLPFMKYQGSAEICKLLEVEMKQIIYQCSKRKAATYLELKLLIDFKALFNPVFLNENISGTFFKDSLDGLIYDEDLDLD